MPSRWLRLNNGTKQPPRLRKHAALWTLVKYPPGENEWTLEQKIAAIAEAGFHGVEAGVGSKSELELLLRRYGLDFGVTIFPNTLAEARKALKEAKQAGAIYVNMHLGSRDWHKAPAKAKALVEGVLESGLKEGLPIRLETHRGRMTENRDLTLQLLKLVGPFPVNGDFSHHAVASEIGPEQMSEKIIAVCEQLHARPFSAECLQISVGEGNTPALKACLDLWERVLKTCRAKARPGDEFTVVPENGPPAYAYTLPDGREVTDRWKDAVTVMNLIEQRWVQIQK
jgi:hypothetical protein